VTSAGQTHNYSCVIKVHKNTDGLVRFRNHRIQVTCGGKVPSDKLIMVVPIEEQTFDDVSDCMKVDENDDEDEHDDLQQQAEGRHLHVLDMLLQGLATNRVSKLHFETIVLIP
jgi:hypothetical protein